MPPKRKILPQFYTEAAGRYLESVERHYSGNGSRQAYFGGIPHAGRPGGERAAANSKKRSKLVWRDRAESNRQPRV
jgi:hypothetical protein